MLHKKKLSTKKIIMFIIVSIILFIIAILFFLARPQKLEVDLSAVMIKVDGEKYEFIQNTKIRLDGITRTPMLSNNEYVGNILFEFLDYNKIIPPNQKYIINYKKDYQYINGICTMKVGEHYSRECWFATFEMRYKKKFKKIAVRWNPTPAIDTSDVIYIVAPAVDFEDATKILSEFWDNPNNEF